MMENVTVWLKRLLDGEQSAVQPLWNHYYAPLLRAARKKLGSYPARVRDEEDVALSAFQSFCRAAIQGRFPRLADRDDLWRLLVTVTARKAVAELRRHHAQRRGGGLVQGESVLLQRRNSDSEATGGLAAMANLGPSPDIDAMMREQCDWLLTVLDDATLQRTAILKLEGHTNDEIAAMLGCARATVERKLAHIRSIWAPLADGDRDDEV